MTINRLDQCAIMLGAALSVLSLGAVASAQTSCINDVDCPDPACGGEVCQWPELQCVPAGSKAAGADGWCTVDSDCKCFDQGARCLAPYCTFTTPPAGAGGSGGSAGTGGSGTAGTGGSAGGGGSDTAGTGGSSAAGAGGSGTAGTGGSGTAGTGAGSSSDSGDDGGCSTSAAPGARSSGVIAAWLLLGLACLRRRRPST